MIRSFAVCLLCVMSLSVVTVLVAEEPAATETAAESAATFSISPMIIKDVQPIEAYLHGRAEATINGMDAALETAFFPLLGKAAKGGIALQGPSVFVMKGVTEDHDKPFDFSAGFSVKPGTEAPEGFTVTALPAFRCATVYYTGPVATIEKGYEAVIGQLTAAGHKPADECREVYLFWEGKDSPRNVIEIQVGLLAE